MDKKIKLIGGPADGMEVPDPGTLWAAYLETSASYSREKIGDDFTYDPGLEDWRTEIRKQMGWAQ